MRRGPLDTCHGFMTVANDGPCGVVETPVFPPEYVEPDYLIIRTGGRIRPRFPIVPTAFVKGVDFEHKIVLLQVSRDQLSRWPEHLPLA